MNNKTLSTHEIARRAGVHRDTILRWLRQGLLPEPPRDRRGWRVFSEVELEAAVRLAAREPAPGAMSARTASPTPIDRLREMDWDFASARTNYLTHSLHPYPAKFIPQIPNALIQELSSVGDTVLDPFCGSGTTLVEARLLRRHAIGMDANPLACLISRAKCTPLTEDEFAELEDLSERAHSEADAAKSGQTSLFGDAATVASGPAQDERITFWFDEHVIRELSRLRHLCTSVTSRAARDLADCAFSSIIVGVSRQDSDTRYVRREKQIPVGETTMRFVRTVRNAIQKVRELADVVDPAFQCEVLHADVRVEGVDQLVDVVVCSPPYPNAYSYHLYHMTRMVWLGFDPRPFKALEIGSHRKYSSRSASRATVATFQAEMKQLFGWLTPQIRPGGYASFVVGDSTIDGKRIRNDQLFAAVGTESGLSLEAVIPRRMMETRKAFNPAHGRIKEEKIVVLKRGH